MSVNSISSSLSGALSSAVVGLSNSNQQLAQDAQAIANPDATDITAPLVDSSQTLVAAQAAADIVRTSNQMLGSLLDAFA